jgi:alginate O-acetyltransferase complex protein AlgI
MFFNSFTFVVFFSVVYAAYLKLGHRKQNILLLCASYVFYGWWDWRFVGLLMLSTVVDFFCAKAMERFPLRKRRFFIISLLTNFGILGFFKYFNFFADSTRELFSAVGFQLDPFTLNVILPVGISFYTFQTVAYSFDVYRGREKATHDFISFAIYVAYFPQLVAGPIERSVNLLPQIQQERTIVFENVRSGAKLVLFGFFKKIFIADGVAPIVNQCFAADSSYGGLSLLLGVYLFAFQIYGDFSGYTDIARGISRMMGIELCLNFKQPYLASSITEFWHRWHISLSNWLRDYLYIPLGGNRKGLRRTYINLLLTMFLGGLWHGAAWTFVVWGCLHGIFLSIHKWLLGDRKIHLVSMPTLFKEQLVWFFKVCLTFNLVCLTWVFFRADSLHSAMSYLNGIMEFGLPSKVLLVYCLFYGGIVMLLDFLAYKYDAETASHPSLPAICRGVMYASMILLMLCVGSHEQQPFIYFQF